MNRYDVIVIGCGAGGYNTAIRASQLGLQVACVERGPDIGGAGLRTGCVPSRLLLHASALYDAGRRRKHAALGIDGPPTLDLARLMAHKTATVQKLSAQVRQRLRAQHATLVGGHARLDGAGRVIVTSMNGAQQTLSAPAIVIATGSEPIPLAAAAFDHARILDSTDALSLDRIPRHLAIVGAGAAGVELGSLWRRLGARVTLVERRERICHWLDHEIAAALDRALRRQGIGIRLSTEVVRIDTRADGVSLALRVPQDNAPATLDADAVLIAIGRRASTAGLNLASVGMWPDRDGALPQRHASAGIWTVGDAAIGPMSMTKAEEEAIACAEQIAGLPGFVDYSSMPAVLYTSPEVATIGKTEDELRFGGVPYKVGRCALAANAHAAIHRAPEGFVKLLVDARTNLIAGAHLIGAGAAELVSQVAVAMEASMICEDFARVCHPYPAWSEALRQAAMAAGGWMMHG